MGDSVPQEERAPSPFRPGFSLVPFVIAGREDVLGAADEMLASAALDRLTPVPMLLVGPRGVGKTVLLDEIARRAATTYGWAHLGAEATRKPFSPGLARQADALVAGFDEESRAGRMRANEAVVHAQLAGIGGELGFSREAKVPAASDLGAALGRAIEKLAPLGTGVVLTLDEAQLVHPDEFAELGALLQQAVRSDWPLVVAIAGLQGLRDEGRTPTYFERADWCEVGMLDEAAALSATAGPAEAAGRPFEAGAAEKLAAHTGGYPNAVQLYGHHAWRASAGKAAIDLEAVGHAAGTAAAAIERNLFAPRWQATSQREREYLVAVAEVLAAGGEARGGEVARHLGLATSQVSYYRDRLLTKGTLVAEGEALRFSVPGMAGYVLGRARRGRPAEA